VPGRLPASPRATRAVIDLLYSVGGCGDVVGSWDVTGQTDGLALRVRTREVFDSEPLAVEAAETMVKRVLPGGYEALSTTVAARAEGSSGWRGVAEVVAVSAG
jgi:hypothetical protein